MHGVRSGGACQRDALADGQKMPAGRQWHDRDRAGAVIADDQKTFGGVKRAIDGIGTAAIHLVQQCQASGGFADREGADQRPAAMHCIKNGMITAEREQRRIFQPGDMLDLSPAAIVRWHLEDMNAIAAPVAIGRGVTTGIG